MHKSASWTSLSSLDEPVARARPAPVKPAAPRKVSSLRNLRVPSAHALPPFPVMHTLDQLTHDITIESSLHVSAVQALSCGAEFGPISRVAPPTSDHWGAETMGQQQDAAASATSSVASMQTTKALAACLATPTEGADQPEEEEEELFKRGGRSVSVPNLRVVQPGGSCVDNGSTESLERLTSLVRRTRRRRKVHQFKSELAKLQVGDMEGPRKFLGWLRRVIMPPQQPTCELIMDSP